MCFHVHVSGHIPMMTEALVLIMSQATAFRSESIRFVAFLWVELLSKTLGKVKLFLVKIFTTALLQFPAGRQHQSTAPSNHTGRQQRSRSRSPHRNHRESHSYSSSSHREDRKQKAATPPKERYQRQRHHVSK